MDSLLKQSTAATVTIGPVLNADGTAYVTDDLTFANFLVGKNGSWGAMNAAATVAHVAGDLQGNFAVTLTATDVGTIGRLEISVNKATLAGQIYRATVLAAATLDALVTNAAGAAGGLPILVTVDSVLTVPAALKVINATSIAGTSTYVAAAFLNLFNVQTPALTAESVNQTADVGTRIPQVIQQAQIGGAGVYYVLALTSGGAVIHSAGAAVAKSPATLAAADVSGNLPADIQTVKGRAVTDVGSGNTVYLGTAAWSTLTTGDVLTQAGAALTSYDPPTNAEMEARTLAAAAYATPTNITAASGVVLAANGLDTITATEPAGKPTTFRGWVMWLVQCFRRGTLTATTKTVLTEAGATVTTQTVSDNGTTETLGPPT